MMPSIRSLIELKAISRSRDKSNQTNHSVENKEIIISAEDSGQRKRYIRDAYEKGIQLPDLRKSESHRLTKNKDKTSRLYKKINYEDKKKLIFDKNKIVEKFCKNDMEAA